MTICTNCKFMKNKLGGIWEAICTCPSIRHPEAINPINGRKMFGRRDRNGTPIMTTQGVVEPIDLQEYPYARDINKGNCPFYQSLQA